MWLVECVGAYMHLAVSLYDAAEGRGSSRQCHYTRCSPVQNLAVKSGSQTLLHSFSNTASINLMVIQ